MLSFLKLFFNINQRQIVSMSNSVNDESRAQFTTKPGMFEIEALEACDWLQTPNTHPCMSEWCVVEFLLCTLWWISIQCAYQLLEAVDRLQIGKPSCLNVCYALSTKQTRLQHVCSPRQYLTCRLPVKATTQNAVFSWGRGVVFFSGTTATILMVSCHDWRALPVAANLHIQA